MRLIACADWMWEAEVRFKNQGLDSIEVQDNGSGISPENYEGLALKHYTSKLSTYSDLSTLETFGFRGEALSSLSALSQFTVTTCLQSDVPKGTKLEFETSGKLKGTAVVAAQKGTTVSVANLFQNLPVRRRELERNIKREWGKVISLLNQYACIQTGVKFTVSQQPNKGKRIVLFSTKGNKTTRENIINVFGAKTMTALIAMDLKLELEPTGGPSQRWSATEDNSTKEILIRGFISRPVHGEGRQTPDRQMFYVNGRPCGLPQFAKVFNEVYRSFNSSQSPFIFADIQLDTHLYDVNVSPDKRTILLHDQSRMLENLRSSLAELFEKQEYTVPMYQITPFKQTPFKKPTVTHHESTDEMSTESTAPDKLSTPTDKNTEPLGDDGESSGVNRMKNLAAAKALSRNAQVTTPPTHRAERQRDIREEDSTEVKEVFTSMTEQGVPDGEELQTASDEIHEGTVVGDRQENTTLDQEPAPTIEVDQLKSDLLTRVAKLKHSFLPKSLQGEMAESDNPAEPPIPTIAKPVKCPDNASLSLSTTRPPKRTCQEVATITIGDHTVTSIIGTPSKRLRRDETSADYQHSQKESKISNPAVSLPSFNGRLSQMFAAAAAEEQRSTDGAPLHTEELDLSENEESHHSDDSGSETTLESAQEGGTISDDDDAESLPLFMEQDEDDLSSKSLESENEEVLDEEDADYTDKDEEARGDGKIEKVITKVEDTGHEPSEESQRRTQAFLKGGGKGKYSTQSLLQRLNIDEGLLEQRLQSWETQLNAVALVGEDDGSDKFSDGIETEDAEEKLSLTIHKGDFGKMKIVGQFNLGFILAVRPGGTSSPIAASGPTTPLQPSNRNDDELFIIDQHASDEKFNFERLQSTTTVQSQRLVRPKTLELTAVEEEIVIENQSALEKNGFVVSVDESGDEPVGSRCQLLSLPLSRETTFSLADLEELISLLGDNPTITDTYAGEGEQKRGESSIKYVPRPSKVRKMFAMRACRSSIMIGKALSHRQMEKVVRHMGEMERPWNCPHGRPTMRHLCGLGGAWDQLGWMEGDWSCVDFASKGSTDWAGYIRQRKVK